MRKTNRYVLTVHSVNSLCAGMKRIVFTGKDLQPFANTPPGSYLKLLFNQFGEPVHCTLDSKQKLLVRTYTVRHFDQQHQLLTIDFMLHGGTVEDGPASYWASTATIGDKIAVQGPGFSKNISQQGDWVLLMGDLTALPAISAQVEALAADSQGYVILAVEDEITDLRITTPPGIQIIQIKAEDHHALASALHDIEWLSGLPSVWAACEFSSMRVIRSELDEQFKIPRSQVYLTSYWRKGRSEDQHKIDKRQDMEDYSTLR